MQRITITIDDELVEELDSFMQKRSYSSRSEAVRDMVRETLIHSRDPMDEEPCLGILSYLYEHNTRELARRLMHTHHDHHNLSVSTLHMHVTHDECLEVNILKGKRDDLTSYADSLVSQRGVNYGHLEIIPAPKKEQ